MSGPKKLACILCGQRDEDVRMALVRWAQPVGDRVFEAIPRCPDRLACRTRVEDANGEVWPLIDASRETFESTPARKSTYAPAASEPTVPADPQLELEQPDPPAPPLAEPEDVAWLGL